jgi:hypothetical protein
VSDHRLGGGHLAARVRRVFDVTRLILINGAPGSGKSTLARMFVHDHPLALALDIDTVRGMLGRWLDEPTQAGLIARRMALEMAGPSGDWSGRGGAAVPRSSGLRVRAGASV